VLAPAASQPAARAHASEPASIPEAKSSFKSWGQASSPTTLVIKSGTISVRDSWGTPLVNGKKEAIPPPLRHRARQRRAASRFNLAADDVTTGA
jgi:hypothetical protein